MMSRAHHRAIAALVLVLAGTLGLTARSVDDWTASELTRILQHAAPDPPPADSTNVFADDPRAARLGHRLFFDARLSSSGTISCASCHDPSKGFADGLQRAKGIDVGTRHTPTLWNVAYQRWYFWDGRSDSLWAQALQPIERDIEMDGDRLAVAHLIADDPELRRAYEAIFGTLPSFDDESRFPKRGKPGVGKDPRFKAWSSMTPADQSSVNRVFVNVAKALAAYQRKLVSRNAPFDRFAAALADGTETDGRLPPAARRGLRLFIGRGNCRVCHSGPTFSDGEFHNIMVPPVDGGYPKDRGRYDASTLLKADPFNAAGEFSDDRTSVRARLTQRLKQTPEQWGQFKTPGLRNVARTAPYMHQGQYGTLREVLEHYSTLEDAVQFGHHQDQLLVPLNLTEQDMSDLEAFLRSLTDESIDPTWLAPPCQAE